MGRSRIGQMMAVAESTIRDLETVFCEAGLGKRASILEIYGFSFFVVSHTVMLKDPCPPDLPAELQVFGDVMSSSIRLQDYPLMGRLRSIPANPDPEIHRFLCMVDDRVPFYEAIFLERMRRGEQPFVGLAIALTRHALGLQPKENPAVAPIGLLSMRIAAILRFALEQLPPDPQSAINNPESDGQPAAPKG